jgi:hypothetical protein
LSMYSLLRRESSGVARPVLRSLGTE